MTASLSNKNMFEVFKGSGFQLFMHYDCNCVSKNYFSFQKNIDDRLVKIREVITDISLKKMTPSLCSNYFPLTDPRLVELSDGSYKLYINPRMLGGMMTARTSTLVRNLGMEDENIADHDIADKILSVIPKDSLSSVSVHTINYTFEGESTAKKTRKIKVTPSTWEFLTRFFQALVKTKGVPNGILENRAVLAILGSEDSRDKQELMDACKKNPTFCIYISVDVQNFYFECTTSTVTQTCDVM